MLRCHVHLHIQQWVAILIIFEIPSNYPLIIHRSVFLFSGGPYILPGDHSTILGHQKATLKKADLGTLLQFLGNQEFF